MNPIVRIHGGKHYLKDWIIKHFPKNYVEMTYVEPFVGGGSVIFNKKLSAKEVINDIDKDLINIYRTLITDPKELINQLQTYKYDAEIFYEALRNKNASFGDDHIDQACNEFIVRRMSRGGLGKDYAWSNRERGGEPGDENAWKTAIRNLYDINERLLNITILHLDYKKILDIYNARDTFFYLDPPYLQSTRTAKKAYNNEMSDREHTILLNLIKTSEAKILISGYSSLLYNYNLKYWERYEKVVTNHSSQAAIKGKRIEVLWANYDI